MVFLEFTKGKGETMQSERERLSWGHTFGYHFSRVIFYKLFNVKCYHGAHFWLSFLSGNISQIIESEILSWGTLLIVISVSFIFFLTSCNVSQIIEYWKFHNHKWCLSLKAYFTISKFFLPWHFSKTVHYYTVLQDKHRQPPFANKLALILY